MFCQSSSFGSLYPCLTDTWGELPLREDDSEDMVLYGTFRDAVNVGFSNATVKSEPKLLTPVKSERESCLRLRR